MKQFTLNLDVKQQRPVIKLQDGLRALLDTGAYFPVWTDEEGILAEDLNAKLVKKNVSFTGFGGIATGNLYRVMFELGDLIFPSLPIVANNDIAVPFSMILSATMLKGLIYEIDDSNHKFNVTIPDKESTIRNLKVESSCGQLHILCNSGDMKLCEVLLG